MRAALEEDVMQLRLHVGGSFAGELPHVYVSFAFGSTKDCSMEPVRDDGVCNSAHVQALRVRIADPSRIWAAGPSIGTAEEVAPGQQDIYLAVGEFNPLGFSTWMVCRASFATTWPRSMVELRVVCGLVVHVLTKGVGATTSYDRSDQTTTGSCFCRDRCQVIRWGLCLHV